MGRPVHMWNYAEHDKDGVQTWRCEACGHEGRGRPPTSIELPCVEKYGPKDLRRTSQEKGKEHG